MAAREGKGGPPPVRAKGSRLTQLKILLWKNVSVVADVLLQWFNAHTHTHHTHSHRLQRHPRIRHHICLACSVAWLTTPVSERVRIHHYTIAVYACICVCLSRHSIVKCTMSNVDDCWPLSTHKRQLHCNELHTVLQLHGSNHPQAIGLCAFNDNLTHRCFASIQTKLQTRNRCGLIVELVVPLLLFLIIAGVRQTQVCATNDFT